MFDWSWKQILIGLVILAGVILLVAFVVWYAYWPTTSVSSDGATLSIYSDSTKPVTILIPKGYTYSQMVALGAAFKAKVNEEKYDAKFLDAFWTMAVAAFIYQRMYSVEVKISSPISSAPDQFPNKDAIAFLIGEVVDRMQLAGLSRYTVIYESYVDITIALAKQKLAGGVITVQAAAPEAAPTV